MLSPTLVSSSYQRMAGRKGASPMLVHMNEVKHTCQYYCFKEKVSWTPLCINPINEKLQSTVNNKMAKTSLDTGHCRTAFERERGTACPWKPYIQPP